jgi:hypothetical protein
MSVVGSLTVLLLLVAPTAVMSANSTFTCDGICGEGGVNTNPDLTVTYNWDPRVPVGSSTVGETEQTLTCAQIESRLYSFSDDPTECADHQRRVQEAGCTCGGSALSVLLTFLAGVVACTMLL